MPAAPHREVEHDIAIAAPPDAVYRLIADVGNWPQIFGPTVHVERVGGADAWERIRIWATANGTAKTWVSRRDLDPGARRIAFHQERSQPPVGGMSGEWVIEPLGGDRCRVRLLHAYHAVDGDPDGLAWIDRAVDTNSRAELGALAEHAELAHAGSADGPLLTFDDTVDVDGHAKDVYDFLNEAGSWDTRLPHVARVSLEEPDPGLQILEMDTTTRDGGRHTTRSVRVCRPHTAIHYKQIQVPALMSLHTGSWLIGERAEGGVSVTSRHTIRINEAAIGTVLGGGASLTEARGFVREALGANSRATLGHAKAYAEERA
ncbi:aromatase/cyclase [Actinomadura roseirufa]|uniref:aromatase/cyclase n=1 Tax=Actinomadura roseirufa TaxID=2094049 RepID=UPI00104166C9|nr:aromatase/cyclase [Actinomadura roseirufa]